MPDKRVETWESKLYKADWSELSLWANEDDNVIVCLSPMARNLLLDMISFDMRWTTRWVSDKSTGTKGDVPEADFIPLVEEIERSLIMPLGCGEDLERIAVALEAMNDKATEALEFVDAQYISLSEFINFLDLAGLDKFIPWLDAAGELLELLSVIPDLNIRLPLVGLVQTITEIFRHADYKTRLEHIHWALEAGNLGQAGPGVTAIIDALLGLVPDPVEEVAKTVAGPVGSTVSTLGIDLVTLISGNYMTNRTDDIRNALQGGILPPAGYNVTQKLDQLRLSLDELGLTLSAAVTGAIGGVDVCGCVTVGEDDPPATEDPPVPDEGDPPEGFPDWDAYKYAKCQIANRIVDEIIIMVERSGLAAEAVASMSIAAVIALLVGLFTGVGFLVVLALALGVGAIAVGVYSILARLMLFYPIQLLALPAELSSDQQSIVCDIYSAANPAAAKGAITTWFVDAAMAVSSDEGWIEHCTNLIDLLTPNALLNGLFAADIQLDPDYIGDVDCDVCGESAECEFNFTYGSGTVRYDGQEFTLSSQDIGGGIHFLSIILPNSGVCSLRNYCVEFTGHSTLNCGPENHTREVYWSGSTYFQGTVQYDWAHQPPGVNCFMPLDTPIPLMGLSVAANQSFTITARIVGIVDGGPGVGLPDLQAGCS